MGARAAARGVGADGADDGDDSRVSSGSTLARSAPGERVAAGDRRRARVGRMMEFLAGPMRLMKKAMPEYGEVFTVPVFHKRITFLIGPKVSEFFFKAKDTEMSQKEVYEFNVPTFGKGVVFDVDHTTRAEQFRFFADSLKSNRLRQYVGMMVKEAEDFFGKWGDEGEVDLLDALSELIVLTASRCLLGREIRETLFAEVTTLVHDLDKGMVPLSVFFPYAPIEAHRKRDKARKDLAAIFDKVIQARRESGASEPDVLQTFIDARYKDGSRLTNDQVLGMLIAVLFAGQHTSSITHVDRLALHRQQVSRHPDARGGTA